MFSPVAMFTFRTSALPGGNGKPVRYVTTSSSPRKWIESGTGSVNGVPNGSGFCTAPNVVSVVHAPLFASTRRMTFWLASTTNSVPPCATTPNGFEARTFA